MAQSFSVESATLRFAIPWAAGEWGAKAGWRRGRGNSAVLKVGAGSGHREGQLEDHRNFLSGDRIMRLQHLGISKAHGREVGMT